MDPRLFQQAIRSATVTYSVPFLVAIFLLFGLLCLGGAMFVNDALRWLIGGCGCLAVAVAAFCALYGLLVRPDMLRSEAHEFRMTIAEIVGDPDVDREVRSELAKQLQLETPRERRRGHSEKPS